MGWNAPAIVLAGILIAAAVLFGFRWEAMMVASPDGTVPMVLRFDRWSGRVAFCEIDLAKSLAAGAKAPHLDCPAP